MEGLTEIPAIITELDDDQSAEVALVENIQRRNLTSIEEAKSYKKILDRGQLTQEQLSSKMGISQPTIANKLRLLNLDEDVQEALMNEKISERHARSLLQFSDPEQQKSMLHRIITERLTVRLLDQEIKKILHPESISEEPKQEIETLETLEIEETPTEEALNTEQQEMLEQLVEEAPEEIESVEIETLELDETAAEKLEKVKENAEDIEIKSHKKKKLLNLFEQNDYPSLEDEATNMNVDAVLPGFDPRSTEDEINPVEEETDLTSPDVVVKPEPIPEPESGIIKGDLGSVKTAYQKLEETILKEGFKITTEDFDFEDLYQVIIKIDKQAD